MSLPPSRPLPHNIFPSVPEQPEPGLEKAVFPLRPEHSILAAFHPLYRPRHPGPAGNSEDQPHSGPRPLPQLFLPA